MKILSFDWNNKKYVKQGAELLTECFPQAYLDTAHEEIKNISDKERIALMAVSGNNLVGFVGAIPQYGKTGWELHPLAVTKDFRSQGVGSKLVDAIELECKKQGCLTIYLGTDDEFFDTSLSQSDLFVDTFEKIENIQNLNKHAYEFYIKKGYKITGVLPDVNGLNKPDIFMAKRLV